MKFIAIVTVLLCIVCTFATNETPGVKPNPNGPGGKTPRVPRTVTTTVTSTKFTVKATCDTSKDKSRISFSLSRSGFPNMKMQYFNKSDAGTSMYVYRIGVTRLLEYNNADGNNTVSASNIVNKLSLMKTASATPSWTAMSTSTYKIGTNGATAYSVETTGSHFGTVAGLQGIEVKLNATVATDLTTVGNLTYSPQAMKFDVTMQNLVYTNTSTRWAMVVDIIANNANPINKDGVGLIKIGGFGAFEYQNAAKKTKNDLTVEDVDVNAAAPEADPDAADAAAAQDDTEKENNEGHTRVVFTFPTDDQPVSITLDPALSFDEYSISAALPTLPALFVAVFCLLLSLFF